ncbi:MAG: hypothetical protein AAF806_12585 [Bacteroidota bacterium]
MEAATRTYFDDIIPQNDIDKLLPHQHLKNKTILGSLTNFAKYMFTALRSFAARVERGFKGQA